MEAALERIGRRSKEWAGRSRSRNSYNLYEGSDRSYNIYEGSIFTGAIRRFSLII